MRHAGFRLRTLTALVALSGLGLGWAQHYGWRGGLHGLFLSFTQVRGGWWFCGAFGLLIGREFRGEPRRRRLLGLAGAIALMIYLATWTIHRWHYPPVWTPGSTRGPVDSALFAIDFWLQERSFIPHFWKHNCTHTPLAMVLGLAIAPLSFSLGLTIGGLIPGGAGGRPAPED